MSRYYSKSLMDKKMSKWILSVVLISGVASAAGCGVQTAASTSNGGSTPVDAEKYLLKEEPDGAIGVISAREEAQNDQDIVLVGRIGGRDNPWIKGRSAFMMVDASLQMVSEGEECEEGAFCTGDCCAAKLTGSTTLVKIVDENGRPLPVDGRDLLAAKTQDMVVVKGKVVRDDKEKTFVVLANGVYVRR